MRGLSCVSIILVTLPLLNVAFVVKPSTRTIKSTNKRKSCDNNNSRTISSSYSLLRLFYTNHNNNNNNQHHDEDYNHNKEYQNSTIGATTKSIYESLQQRQDDLSRGIGRRFVVRTQLGFLNVHSNYSQGPFATDNVVAQLHDGQIVTSVGPIVEEVWIPHDHGGYSVCEFQGHVFLEPLEE